MVKRSSGPESRAARDMGTVRSSFFSLVWPKSSRPGIALPYGENLGSLSISRMRFSTLSLMTCSQRHASSCTYSSSRPIMSESSRSARRCLRITSTALWRPSSVSSRWRSGSTVSRPCFSMRATVWETVGPECSSRSAMRARMGTMPSSSSSRMVRKYISVVSMRSVIYLSQLSPQQYLDSTA